MINPAIYTLKMFGGDVFDLSLNWKDDDGNLFDLSGYHARHRFFRSKSDRTIVVELTDTDGITLGDGTTEPNIACQITSADTVLSNEPTYYTLEIQEPSGEWQRLMEGPVTYEK